MKLRRLTTFFVLYVVALSFIPLIHQTFIAQSRWLGYGLGAYAFQSPSYFVLFNDPYDGSSKPNIHINPSLVPNERISLIEFSDWTSYVNGYNLFNDFNVSIGTSPKALDVTYTGHGLVIHKSVEVPTGDYVSVKIVANKEIAVHIEMWKWVFTSVNGVNVTTAPKPTVLPISQNLDLTFLDQSSGVTGSGSVKMSRVPSQIEVWPFENGFNRITVDYVNSEMEFAVSGSVGSNQQPFPTWNYTDLPYVLPIVAIAAVCLYLLLVEKHGKKNKARSRRSRS
ncbi:MAG: hypothetical protein WB643_02250 [Candidatus Bathyarchaeia archaeon]